jgi:hypothetical protein
MNKRSPVETQKSSRHRWQNKAADDEINLSEPVELVALVVKERSVRCRLLESDRIITLRTSRIWELVPGIIVTITPRKQWRYAGHPYLSGEIQSTRIGVKALLASIPRMPSGITKSDCALASSLWVTTFQAFCH